VIRFIMEKLRETAAHYVGDDVDSAVLTAPAWWTDEHKAVLVKVFFRLHVGCRVLLRSAS
jgi:molecular chaperone DnaK (HSP70)